MRTLPPLLRILALAASVNLRAATVNLGTSSILLSSVTVPTTTAILSLKRKDIGNLELTAFGQGV